MPLPLKLLQGRPAGVQGKTPAGSYGLRLAPKGASLLNPLKGAQHRGGEALEGLSFYGTLMVILWYTYGTLRLRFYLDFTL